MLLRCLFLILLMIVPNLSFRVGGQNAKALIKKRKKIEQDITATQALLKDIRKNKASKLDEYQTIKTEIEQRTDLINTISAEIDSNAQQTILTEKEIQTLEARLERYKADYGNMLRHAYQHRNANKRLLFVFSATNFNNAMRRWQYFVRYDRQRKNKIQQIATIQDKLAQKVRSLATQRAQKQTLLQENQEQQQELAATLAAQAELLEKLKAEEADIQADLAEKEAAKAQLTDAIDQAIRADIQQKQSNSRKRSSNASASPKRNASDKKIERAFRKAKGKLPMPVVGVVTSKYGTRKHPTLKRVTVKNDGIDIKTYANSPVKCIFEGEVMNIFTIPGAQNAVMVRHGSFYSVYSNLAKVSVQKGQKIQQGAVIGRVGISTKTRQPSLHIEIWKNSQHLNPLHWLKK